GRPNGCARRHSLRGRERRRAGEAGRGEARGGAGRRGVLSAGPRLSVPAARPFLRGPSQGAAAARLVPGRRSCPLTPPPRPAHIPRLSSGWSPAGRAERGDEHGAVPGQLALRLLAERDGGSHLRLLHHHRLQGAQRARQHRYLPGHAALNQVVLWDKIMLRGDNPRLFLKDMKSKYFFFDDGNGLKGNRNVTLTLSWNVVPNAGILPLVTGLAF
uniref:Signal peptidase complex subunit 3 n=1 Tax=Anser brachyrhynchus TaxID=132585 RepID=A0A8B9CEA4_9AVES